MDSLFDQDSAPDSAQSAESGSVQGARAATADQSVAERPEEEGAGNPDGSDSVGSGVGLADHGVDWEGGNGLGPVTDPVEAARVEPHEKPDSSGEADPGPPVPAPTEPEASAVVLQPGPEAPAEPEAPVADAPVAVPAAAEPETRGEPEAAAEPEAPAEPSGETPPMPVSPLPPPPRVERAPAAGSAPSWPPGPVESGPPVPLTPRPAPATEAAYAVRPAPSAAGPAPSQLGRPRRTHARLGRRLANRSRHVLRWPAAVRATPDQRASSLVMLFVVAVAIGVVGSALLLGVVFLIISTLGHGSGG
jgi:hypothetical protein